MKEKERRARVLGGIKLEPNKLESHALLIAPTCSDIIERMQDVTQFKMVPFYSRHVEAYSLPWTVITWSYQLRLSSSLPNGRLRDEISCFVFCYG
jgi:hypothetical protein